MEQNERERIIRQYVDRAMATWRDESATDFDMEEVARELGMSEEQIAEVMRVGEICFEEGKAHRLAMRLDEAIEQLTIAAAIDPSNVERLEELAVATMGRYTRDGDKADRKETSRLVKRALKLGSGRDSIHRLLHSLDDVAAVKEKGSATGASTAKSQAASPGKPIPADTKKKIKMTFIIAAINALFMGGVFIFMMRPSKHEVKIVEHQPRAIPVEQSAGAGAPAVDLRVEESLLDPSTWNYRVRGSIVSTPRGASLTGAALELAALDSSGAEALTAPITLRPCGAGDDSLCFDYNGPFVRRLEKVSLRVKGAP